MTIFRLLFIKPGDIFALQMKKLLAAILLLVYFTVSTGFVVSLHYCMDRFDSARIGGSSSDECGKCGMHQDESKCCWDDVKMVKLQTNHLASKALIAEFSVPVVKEFTTDFLLAPLYYLEEKTPVLAHGPPLSEQETYLQNCVFRL